MAQKSDETACFFLSCSRAQSEAAIIFTNDAHFVEMTKRIVRLLFGEAAKITGRLRYCMLIMCIPQTIRIIIQVSMLIMADTITQNCFFFYAYFAVAVCILEGKQDPSFVMDSLNHL